MAHNIDIEKAAYEKGLAEGYKRGWLDHSDITVTGIVQQPKEAIEGKEYLFTLEKLEAIKKGSYNDGWSDCLKKYDPKNKQSKPSSIEGDAVFKEWQLSDVVKLSIQNKEMAKYIREQCGATGDEFLYKLFKNNPPKQEPNRIIPKEDQDYFKNKKG